ncbi:MAG: hypothetical protein JW989_03210 [Chlorobiaceae bacterium]|jgi:hypothetical protein|nr:hypothetical protein [Chlorobiaceae bacterium]
MTTFKHEIMPGDHSFIAGIDRYCDRWCERCAFTSKCRSYHLERQPTMLDQPEIFNAAFWIEMDGQLSELIQRIASETAGQVGVPELPSMHHSAREHPFAMSALEYAGMIDDWKDSGKQWPLLPEEAWEIIRQYSCFLYPKLVRAIEVGMSDRYGVHDEEYAEGTAKTVLITIDRSLGAWGMVYRRYPDYEDAVLALLLHLDRLRKSVEALFPNARSFHRPVLDD